MKKAAYVLTSPKTEPHRLASFLVSYGCAKLKLGDDSAPAIAVVHGMNSERFPRVPNWRDGNGLDRRGHTACYWGHIQMWRQALAENDADFDDCAFLFFEDDCRLDLDFWDRADAAFGELPPDWDVLYFGGEHRVHGRPAPRDYSENLYKIENVNRLHAYAMRAASVPKILLWFSEHHDWGHNFADPRTGQSEAEVDYALGSLTESGFLNGFALRTWAAEQSAAQSATQGVWTFGGRWELDPK